MRLRGADMRRYPVVATAPALRGGAGSAYHPHEAPMDRLKYTKIIATVGPATAAVDKLRNLIRAGADCFRINFSHGDGASLQPLIEAARAASRAEGKHVT